MHIPSIEKVQIDPIYMHGDSIYTQQECTKMYQVHDVVVRDCSVVSHALRSMFTQQSTHRSKMSISHIHHRCHTDAWEARQETIHGEWAERRGRLHVLHVYFLYVFHV